MHIQNIQTTKVCSWQQRGKERSSKGNLINKDLETFRKQLQKIPDRLKRDICTYNIAVRFGMVQENREPIKFYFEKLKE